MQDSPDRIFKSGGASQAVAYDKKAGGFSEIGDSGDVGERCQQACTSNQRSVCEQCVPSGQEGWG